MEDKRQQRRRHHLISAECFKWKLSSVTRLQERDTPCRYAGEQEQDNTMTRIPSTPKRLCLSLHLLLTIPSLLVVSTSFILSTPLHTLHTQFTHSRPPWTVFVSNQGPINTCPFKHRPYDLSFLSMSTLTAKPTVTATASAKMTPSVAALTTPASRVIPLIHSRKHRKSLAATTRSKRVRHDPHQDHQQQQQEEEEEEEPQGGADHPTLQTSQIYFGGDKNDPLILHTRQSRTSDEDTFTSTTSPTSTTSLLVEQKYIPNSISIENKKNKKVILERMVQKEYYNTEQQNLNTVQGDPYEDETWNDDELQESMSSSIHVRQFKPMISSTASQGTVHSTIKKPRYSKKQKQQQEQEEELEGDETTSIFTNTLPGVSSKKSSNNNNNRASTMPGFIERKSLGRRKSFTDGIRIVQQAHEYNPQTLQKLSSMLFVDSPESLSRRKVNSDAMYITSASVPDSLIAFTEEIHKEQRITPKQELELATKTQEAIRLQYLYENLQQKLQREPTDIEWCAAAGKMNIEALRQTIQDGIDAKNELVTSNLRMVQGVVNVYLRNGLGSQYNAGDLMQEGILALIRAAEKFEPKRGFRFSTYAMYWIRAAIKRAQVGQSRSITVPQRLYENHRKISKVEKELGQSLGRQCNLSEIAIASGLPEVQVQRCLLALAQRCYSLDSTIENKLKPGSSVDRKSTLYDIVQEKPDDHECRYRKEQSLRGDLLHTLRGYLSPHEVELLALRFGLMDEYILPLGFSGPLSIAQVSKLVGMKPDKVRRRINTSLRQLRSLISDEWGNYERELFC